MAWVQLGGAAIGAVAGSKGGQSSGGTPKFVKRQIKRGYSNLNSATERPVGEAIAPLNADQLNANNLIRSNVGLGRGDIQSAIDTARRVSGGVQPGDISQFYNPYEDQVIGSATADLNRQRQMNLLEINGQAEAAGAFGGDREAVAKALASENWNRQIADTIGGLRFGGYNSALDAAFRNSDTMLGGAGGVVNGVDAQRRAAYGDASAVGGVGDSLYAYDQSLLDYPLKMAQMQIDAGGVGMGVQRPQAGTGGGVSGAISGALGGMDLGGVLGGLFSGGGGSGGPSGYENEFWW